jgi:REP element-mobilizing transposase RayT
MSQSLVKVLLHIVFSTKNRLPLIDPAWEPDMYGYIGGVLKGLGHRLLIANGIEDHSHLLVSCGKRIEIPNIIGSIKRDSTNWIKREGLSRGFAWQNGYGAFSIGQSQKDTVFNYIRNQKEHHRRVSFQDEFLELIRRYDVPFDERYLWD